MSSLNNIQLISIKQNKSRRILFELPDDSTTTCLPYHQTYITFIIITINVKVLTRFKQNVNIYFMVIFKSFTKIWLIANVNNLPIIKPCGLISNPYKSKHHWKWVITRSIWNFMLYDVWIREFKVWISQLLIVLIPTTKLKFQEP